MYVITHHHSYDEVLLGPIDWNPRFIASVLESDLDLSEKPNILESDVTKVPYDILPNVRVRPVKTVKPNYDSRIQFLNGPYWTYTDEEATETYVVEYKSVETVRNELKQNLANARYKKETSGFKKIIQNKEVSIDTDRDKRDVYIQKYLLMNEIETTDWKFPEGWLELTKDELVSIVESINAHIQNAFNWELQKSVELDNATTHEELLSVTIVEQPLG